MSTSIRIVVADDHEVVRAGYAGLLATQADFTVVGTARDGAEAVRVCREQAPDVVLMDVRMPVMDGIRATARLQEAPRAPRVLVLTTFDLDEHVYDALAPAASGFLLKDVIAEFARIRPRAPARGRLGELTPRETDVLRLLAEGLSNPELAERLGVGEETVKTHVSRILSKLGLRDRTQAVVMAYETGLVVPRTR